MIDTSPLREVTIQEAARITHHNRRTLLARAEREGWKLHCEPNRTFITLAALAEGLGVPVASLFGSDAAEVAGVRFVASPAASASAEPEQQGKAGAGAATPVPAAFTGTARGSAAGDSGLAGPLALAVRGSRAVRSAGRRGESEPRPASSVTTDAACGSAVTTGPAAGSHAPAVGAKK